jgi:uncharacterized protein
MQVSFKIIKTINIVALAFLLFGAYGLVFTGAIQVFAAIFYFLAFPKNKSIYIYFSLVVVFFLFWDHHSFSWLFLIPTFLLFFLTYIIHFQKMTL